MAAADEAELKHMVATCAAHDSGPIALRYPRGEGVGVDMPERGDAAGDRQGPHRARRLAHRAAVAGHAARRGAGAAEELEARGLSTTVADARFAKPLDRELILGSPLARGAVDDRGGRRGRLWRARADAAGGDRAGSIAA